MLYSPLGSRLFLSFGERDKHGQTPSTVASQPPKQRHLAEEGTSFKELLNEARVTLGRNYVEEGRLSVTEIAFVLGFADTSTFSRAFKRWTGMSPREYAQKNSTQRRQGAKTQSEK